MVDMNDSSLYCPGTLDTQLLYPGLGGLTAAINDSMDGIPLNGHACNCTNWNMNIVDATPISILRIITSIISIIGAASIILSVLLTGKLSAAEVHPLFILSVGDFILSILWMIGGIVWLNPGEGGWAREESDSHAGMCYVLAVATTMAEMVVFSLTAVYALNALLRIREVYLNKGRTLNKKDDRKVLRHCLTVVVYIISWVLPLVVVLPITETQVGIEETNKGCWCILDFFNLRPDDGLHNGESNFDHFAIIQASILGVVFTFTTIVIIVLYVLTFVYARKVLSLQDEAVLTEGKGPKMIKTIVIRLTLFVAIFFISGFPTMLASILVWSEKTRLHLHEPEDRTILYLHAIFSPLQGFLNAVVYGWSRREFRKAINMQERMKFSRGTGDRGASSRYQSLNTTRSPEAANSGPRITNYLNRNVPT